MFSAYNMPSEMFNLEYLAIVINYSAFFNVPLLNH